MENYVKADTGAMEGLKNKVAQTVSAVLEASQSFYKAVNGSAWDDNISREALEVYRRVVSTVQTVLQEVDGVQYIVADQIADLEEYASVTL